MDSTGDNQQEQMESSSVIKSAPNYCYILYNEKTDQSYNGYTNNLSRRIRQHNGEIKGGAKYTTRRPVGWKYLAYVTSDDPRFTKIMALRTEWQIRFPNGKRPREKHFNNPEGRLKGMQIALSHDKFAGLDFIVHVCSKYAHCIPNCHIIE